MADLKDTDSGSTTAVRVGAEVVIRLAENPTTGYAWEFRQTGSGGLSIVDNRFEAGGSAGSPPLPGAAGYRVVRLVGKHAGTVHLEAVERRPWETSGGEQRRREFTIVVQ